jgi:hypothetical protein
MLTYAWELLAVDFEQSVNLAGPLFWITSGIGAYLFSQNVPIDLQGSRGRRLVSVDNDAAISCGKGGLS